MQPTRVTCLETDLDDFSPARPLFGLAPGGVCLAVLVAKHAVRSYRTLSPLPLPPFPVQRRSALCGTFPKVALAGCYPAPCFHGARTFLPALIRNLGGAAIRPADPINKEILEDQVKFLMRQHD